VGQWSASVASRTVATSVRVMNVAWAPGVGVERGDVAVAAHRVDDDHDVAFQPLPAFGGVYGDVRVDAGESGTDGGFLCDVGDDDTDVGGGDRGGTVVGE
jgi:hypothetical protein